MDHGMVDAVVARSDQAAYIGKILDFLMGPKGTSKAA
jgi:acetyl-CoA carboxylase beta subunit